MLEKWMLYSDKMLKVITTSIEIHIPVEDKRMLLSQDLSKTLQSGIYYFNNKRFKDQSLNTEACLTLPKKIPESVYFKIL